MALGVKDLRGRRGLVTGASSGLGPIIARALAAEGVELVISGRRVTELERLASELGNARVVTADISRLEEVQRLAAEAGSVDILVANAGVPGNGRLLDLELQEIEEAVAVNLLSVVVLTRLLLPSMVARGSGHIVLMASMAGRVPAPGSSIYNATKFGLRGFGYALRSENRGTGVGVSMISPTFVRSAGMWADTGVRARVRETSPERVAAACVRAIRRDLAEVAVAPIEQRLFSRVVSGFPDLMQPFFGSGSVPREAVERQRAKR